MGFRFSLAAVLKLREAVENRELYRLERLQQEIAQTVQSLEQLNEQKHKHDELCHDALVHEVHGMELMHWDQVRESLDARRSTIEGALATLQSQRQQQLDKYQAARRDRQVLADMFKEQRKAYQLATDRKQQRIQDDIFISRRHRE